MPLIVPCDRPESSIGMQSSPPIEEWSEIGHGAHGGSAHDRG